ncbi:MAG: hypothetical protein KatS3mg104_1309 [Phycisphaerae bacterium]|nr:MAG: hypothetical protein KatS3mg104_1309 [Phycisphaerae bacterium]
MKDQTPMNAVDLPVVPASSVPGKESVPEQTPRDIQRNALRDLLTLSQELSRIEAELDVGYRQESQQLKTKFERQIRDYDYRLESVRRQIDEKNAEKSQAISEHYQREIKKIQSSYTGKRTQILSEYDSTSAELKNKFDQASWLADSVLEAAELQANQTFRQDAERHSELIEEINRIEATVVQLIQNYGISPVPADHPSLEAESIREQAKTVLDQQRQQIGQLLARLKRFGFAWLLTGVWPAVLVLLIGAGTFVYVQSRQADPMKPDWQVLVYPMIGALLGGSVLIGLLKWFANSQIRKTYAPLRTALADARLASQVVHENASRAKTRAIEEAVRKRNDEVERVKNQLLPLQKKAQQQRDTKLKSLETEHQQAMNRVEEVRSRQENDLAAWKDRQLQETAGKVIEEQNRLKIKLESELNRLQDNYSSRRSALQRRWQEGLEQIQAPIGQTRSITRLQTDWSDLERNWTPPDRFPRSVNFGSLEIDMNRLSAGIPRDGSFQLALPEHFAVPAMMAFPREASVLIQTDASGRQEGLAALQMIMTRLLISLPPGRARFTILDPVGLGQSFAGFMHLADHDDQLVTTRIWTTPEQIEERLRDLTEHMETVIQKYLRNEFETIDDYNAQAGELAEPYRFLVIADFPRGFEGDAGRRLMSIARTGAKCGVYTLILRDIRQPLPPEIMIEDLEASAANIVRESNRWVWKDEVYGQFPLNLDTPPDDEQLSRIVHRVGEAAKQANRVEVDFETIAPRQEQFWSLSAAEEITVPIGRMGATRLQYFRCGRGVAQHTLVAGKTGSGKSTLLHALVTNLAMWYSPDEVEFYLIDFKKGVEFKTYADYKLPHARAIAVESDREFGLSVLQRIDAELSRRGELFRKAGVQDLASYRQTPDAQVMPRVMLIIDEFQEFFTEDDKLAQDAQLLLDRLVRQGRAFGVHVFLGSQTIGGAGSLARTTLGQMAIRIALQCSETDSQLILGDNNSAARLLSRPGEAIYNDAGGAVENNSPFQVAWLADARRETYLSRVNEHLKNHGTRRAVTPPIVFEGNAPADIAQNHRLSECLSRRRPVSVPLAWIGDPVAIKEPTAIPFRRQSGANVLIIGQQDEQAVSILISMILSLAAQLPTDLARFVLLDGTPADSPLTGKLASTLRILPHRVDSIEYRRVEESVSEWSEELKKRQGDEQTGQTSVFLVVNGLQRYRMLRKGDDDFSFSLSDEPQKASPAKQFVELIKEGPNVGIHVVTWCDTLASIERTFDRGMMREFDHRVLFQMSSNDSSNLIDSPAANKLGFFRALLYSEEQGVMEKFRPYGIPREDWLIETCKKLRENEGYDA